MSVPISPAGGTDPTWQEIEARVLAADWHNIPRGHYAVGEYDDQGDPDAPGFGRLLGYRLFERRVPRVYRNGRQVGRNQWRTGAAYLVDPADRARFDAHMADKASGDTTWDQRVDILDILDDVASLDLYRRTFGQITGRCGCCGRKLTDPDSKMRGIGPDCVRALGDAA